MIAEKYRTSLFFFLAPEIDNLCFLAHQLKIRTLVLFEDGTFFEVKDPVFDIRFGLLIT